MNKIPLEDNHDLAKKYGIAFSWINSVEDLLKWTLLIKSKLTTHIPKLIEDLFDNQTLGGKIQLSEDLIDKKIIGKLRDLNNKRRILAHGVIDQMYLIKDGKLEPTNQYGMFHQGKNSEPSKLMDEIIQLCKELDKDLRKISTSK